MDFKKVRVCIVNFRATIHIQKTNNTINNKYKVFLLTILYVMNVGQLNYKNRPKNLCVCFPEYHQQYSLVLSILYIPVHFLDNCK